MKSMRNQAEAAVHLGVVARVVAVCVGLEDGIEQQARRAKLCHVIDPAVVHELEQPMLEHAVIFVRGPAETQRVDLIDD